MSSAIIVAGEAPESEDELPQAEINQLLQRNDQLSVPAVDEGRRLSLGSIGALGSVGLNLSSVTASVGKQIGALSGIDLNGSTNRNNSFENRVQHPTILHKKLFDKNLSIHQSINKYFEDMFLRNNDELTKIITDCYTVNTYMQESSFALKNSVEQCRNLDESIKNISDTFSQKRLPATKLRK